MRKNRRIIRWTAAVLAAGLLAGQMQAGAADTPAAPTAGKSALEAFNVLQAGETGEEARDERPSTDALLLDVMEGVYADLPQDRAEAAGMAAMLPVFCSVTGADIARFASGRDLYMAQVRNAYYKALAIVLQAKMAVDPDAEEKYANIRTILQLFLLMETDAAGEAEKDLVRASMTSAYSREMAQAFGLPEEFVSFIIMDRNWSDESWKNDTDWQGESGWYAQEGESFGEYGIGSRDSGGRNDIARMQEALIRLGYLSGSADGVFGPRTQAALLEFQLANGLRPTGIYTVYEQEALSGSRTVSRRDYSEEFWDPDDVYDDDDDDRYEYDDDRYEYDDADDDDRYEYDDADDDDRYEYDDDDDDD